MIRCWRYRNRWAVLRICGQFKGDIMAKSVKVRCEAIEYALKLIKKGKPPRTAWEMAAGKFDSNVSTLYRWYRLIEGKPRGEWSSALQPKWNSEGTPVEFSQAAWDYFLAVYNESRSTSVREAYCKTQEVAESKGWELPSERTVNRRVTREGFKKPSRYEDYI